MLNPYLAVVLATIIWGSTGIFIKYLNLPPTTIAFFRMVIPAFILFIYFKIKKVNLFRDSVKLILLVSSIGVVDMLFYFIAYTKTSIANSLITLYTWPIFATIFSAIFLREKLGVRNIFLLIVSFIGVILVYLGNSLSLTNKDFVGITSMLVSAALFAVMIIIFKKLSITHSNFEIIFYHNMIGAVVFLPFLFINRPLPTITQSGVAVVYALLIGFLAYIPYFFGLKYIKTSSISLLSYLEVVSGILFGIILLHETLMPNTIIGGVLIVGSTLLIKR